MTSARSPLVRARAALHEADDLLLTAILRHREPERFNEALSEAIVQLAEAAAELGYRLEPVGEKPLALAWREVVATAFKMEGVR